VIAPPGSGEIAVPCDTMAGSALTLTATGQRAVGWVYPATRQIVIAGPAQAGPSRSTVAISSRTCPVIVTRRRHSRRRCQDGGRLGPGDPALCAAIRAQRGIGDFTRPRRARSAAAHGVAAIGLTPLHALFPDQPDRCSPYSPNSRCFLNVLYLDPEAMPEFATCEAARVLRDEPAFAAELARLRSAALVDYPAVAACKLRVFDLLYQHFRDRHLARGDERAAEFYAFQQAAVSGFASSLRSRRCARISRAVAHFAESFRGPDSLAVVAFAAEHAERHLFRALCKRSGSCSRASSGRAMRDADRIYLDIAVGVDRDSASLRSQDYLVDGWSIGAPPDNWNPAGQS
jgi:4-alpha-glucanotransferase